MINIEGRNPCLESLRAGRFEFSKLYLQENINLDEKIKDIVNICNQKKIKIEYIAKSKLDKLSETGTHQGVILLATKYDYKKLDELITKVDESNREAFFILVRESLYEHNLGAIIRTAISAGANGIIITKNCKITPNVIRTSMGAVNYVDIVQLDIFSAISRLKDYAIRIIGIEISDKSINYYDSDLKGNVCLIIGGEDHPLTDDLIDKLDGVVKIPLLSPINSLNMSVAAGIVMYEKLKQEVQQ